MPTNLTSTQKVTILNTASLSGILDFTRGGGIPVGIQMPAAWTAANLTFQGSVDGTTFGDIYDATGTEVTVTAAVSRYILLNPNSFAGFRQIKVRSGTTAVPVAQGADRDILIVVRDL